MGKKVVGAGGAVKKTAAQVVTTVLGAAIITALGIDRLPAVFSWGEDAATTTVVETTTVPSDSTAPTDTDPASNMSTPGATTLAPRSSGSSGTAGGSGGSGTVLATAKFSNDVLATAAKDGSPTWSTVPLSKAAITESTQHDNAAKAKVLTSTTPNNCEWVQDTLRFKQAGTCNVRISIAKASKNPRYKDLTKTYRIKVKAPSISSPGNYSPHLRVSSVATARGNFLTYGKEVPTELTYGDVLGYWHMRMTVTMKSPDPALGTAKCHRVYARYQYGTKQSYNDFTEDIVGCDETTSQTGPKEYCVNFQPAWYLIDNKSVPARKEPMGIVDAGGAPLTDNYATVKFARIGWGLEWRWDGYNTAQVPANKTLTTGDKNLAEADTHRPSVEVHEIAAGKCS